MQTMFDMFEIRLAAIAIGRCGHDRDSLCVPRSWAVCTPFEIAVFQFALLRFRFVKGVRVPGAFRFVKGVRVPGAFSAW